MSRIMPCECIGSIPRPLSLQSSWIANLLEEQEAALRDTIERLYAIYVHCKNSPISDGEQTKPSFVSYSISGITSLRGDGLVIAFEDGHTRQLPIITEGPFEYSEYAVSYLKKAKDTAASLGKDIKFKQAVISASAMTLLYPSEGIPNYSREAFIDDVVRCATNDIRQCLDEGAASVQVDFTEARLSLKLDPSGSLLSSLLAVNERVFSNFTSQELANIGIHVCPGADQDSCHSADVAYTALLPPLLNGLSCGRFYLQLKSEKEPALVLQTVQENLRSHQMIFIGVIDVNSSNVETADEVAAFIEQAATYIPLSQLGVTDDCGFSPFGDDVSTSRELAFQKIKARVDGTIIASERLKL